MKKTLFIFFGFAMYAAVTAQTSTPAASPDLKWKKAFQTGLNINQASFSENWKGGGTNSIALGAYFSGRANYESDILTFSNEMKLAYGFQQMQGQTSRKSTDQIFLDSKLGYKFSQHWNLFASLNFSSQFDAGFLYKNDDRGNEHQYLISKFMNPGYLTSSVGLEFKPVDYFWMRFGTGTLRQTFVTDTSLHSRDPSVANNYGVDIGKKIKNEVAFQVIANFNKEIMKNLILKARIMTLAPYDYKGTMLFQADIAFIAKVNKYINVMFGGVILNDNDQDIKVQYNQTFSLGIMYSFSQFNEK